MLARDLLASRRLRRDIHGDKPRGELFRTPALSQGFGVPHPWASFTMETPMNLSMCRRALTFAVCLAPFALAAEQPEGWANLLGKELTTHWTTTGNWILGKDGVVAL